jgi:hypothetical protein
VTGVLARAALVAAAVVAVVWLAYGLRALDLHEEGNATLAAAGRPPSGDAVQSALSSFRAASRWNPDPAPTLDEATLLLSVGRTAEAGRMLEDVTRANPGNVRAWTLLAAATGRTDQRRTRVALRELAALYGRVDTGRGIPGTLRTRDGRLLQVVPKTGQGAVDSSRVGDDRITVGGWAADLRARRRFEQVLVVSRGRIVAATAPFRGRPDLARRFGPHLGSTGFKVSFGRPAVEDDSGRLDVHVFAVSRGEAVPLRFFCRRGARQDLGC